MTPKDIKSIVAENVAALSARFHGRPNKTRLGTETGINLGGAQRVLSGEVSVGVDLLQQIARRYGLQAWQLLVPKFDPQRPPQLQLEQMNTIHQTTTQYSARNIGEQHLLDAFRNMSAMHREDIISLAQRWADHDKPEHAPPVWHKKPVKT